MALEHTDSPTRNGLADFIDTEVNGGGGAGNLVFMVTGDVECATIVLDATAFGAASTGTITLAGVPLSDTDATGSGSPIIAFKFEDNAAAEIFRGTVTTTAVGTGDILLSSVVVGATDTVTMTSFTYSASA